MRAFLAFEEELGAIRRVFAVPQWLEAITDGISSAWVVADGHRFHDWLLGACLSEVNSRGSLQQRLQADVSWAIQATQGQWQAGQPPLKGHAAQVALSLGAESTQRLELELGAGRWQEALQVEAIFDEVRGSSLLRVGPWFRAHQLLDFVGLRGDVVMWNAILATQADADLWCGALALHDCMSGRGLLPDVVTFNTLPGAIE